MINDTYKEIKYRFQNKYFKVIKPKLDYYEQKRLDGQAIWKKKLTFLLIIFTILSLTIYFTIPDLLFFTLTIGFIIGSFIRFQIANKIDCEMKDEFMPIICECFENLSWSKRAPMNEDEFYEVGLVDYYNRTWFDDVFLGNYNGVNFEIIEAKLSHKTGSGKNSHTTIRLNGIILKITLDNENKFNKSHTIIRPDSPFKIPILKLKRTELEDVTFEKKYDVYTNDEVESRVILTTSLMERINNIEKIFKARDISCAFLKNKIYIGLNVNKDMFEIFSFDKPINGAEFFAQMFEELLSIYKLIDHLKIKNNTI